MITTGAIGSTQVGKDASLTNISLCPKCRYEFIVKNADLISYFNSKKFKCPNCNKNLDLWELLLKMIDSGPQIRGLQYSLLGCEHKIYENIVSPDKYLLIDLREEVGEGELLYAYFYLKHREDVEINFPMLNPFHIYPIDNLFRDKMITVYGVPQAEETGETKIFISYWFAPQDIKEDLSHRLLLDAFKFYTEKNYRYMITSAHSAVEIILNKFLEKFLKENGASNKKIKEFLDKTDYFYKLDPLFPLITEIKDLPKFKKEIMVSLKSLSKARNNLMHYGKTDLSDLEKIKRELIAAFLAFKYFKIIYNL